MPSVPRRPPITPQLEESGVVAILRGSTERHVEGVARTLGEAGITCLELTLTTPGAVDALARVRAELDEGVALGMGSVITAEQAAACLDAGADFLVSPGVCAEVAVYAAEHGVACYPGGWTPTELIDAWNLGAPAVKLFPAASGGPRHLRDVRAPLPHIPLVPTGGVALDQIADYLAAGAVAVGLGGPLVGDAVEGGPLPALHERAAAALAAVRSGRERQ
jgi:2-dehydro-3-deoxyphosphogluconate aldolase / (4S)-4-hydroxy-2-oxoglutarate aldolase